ncbi:hypothetical protein FRB99_001993 [Tulasnella sp. 403]|nr:hypothetical protein FRB99_001993 [Tulasnella sp. 403]
MNSYIPLATVEEKDGDFEVIEQPSTQRRRRFRMLWTAAYVAGVLLVGVVLGSLYSSTGWMPVAPSRGDGSTVSAGGLPGGFYPLKEGVHGPASSLRDNLSLNVSYVTSLSGASGMTLRTNRVPIVPPLVPSGGHLNLEGKSANPWPNLSEVFDIDRLSRSIDWPVLEWAQVKKARYGQPFRYEPLEGQVTDKIGCWSTRQVRKGVGPARGESEKFLNLDISFTPIPTKFAIPNTMNWYSFWGLADLLYPLGRSEALALPDGKPGPSDSKTVLPPDEHVSCFDDLFYAVAVRAYEWGKEVSPAWRYVGVYLHFTERVERLAMEMLKRVIGGAEGEPIPPYIALHIRRSDFEGRCAGWKVEDHEQCFPPLSVYDRHVQEVREKLRAKYGDDDPRGNPLYVVATSDEKNPQWWERVKQMGWLFIDHGAEKTSKRLGKWYPSIVDSVVQSNSIGFVGTDGSTFSMVSALRVRDWHGGVSSMVRRFLGFRDKGLRMSDAGSMERKKTVVEA